MTIGVKVIREPRIEYPMVGEGLGYLIGVLIGNTIVRAKYERELKEYLRRQERAEKIQVGDEGEYWTEDRKVFMPVLRFKEDDLKKMSIDELARLSIFTRSFRLSEEDIMRKYKKLEERQAFKELIRDLPDFMLQVRKKYGMKSKEYMELLMSALQASIILKDPAPLLKLRETLRRELEEKEEEKED